MSNGKEIEVDLANVCKCFKGTKRYLTMQSKNGTVLNWFYNQVENSEIGSHI